MVTISGCACPHVFFVVYLRISFLKCLWTGTLLDSGSQVGSRRISLVKLMIGLLMSKKSLGLLTTHNSKRSRIYAIVFMVIIAITVIRADTCICLYTASISSLEMNMHIDG